VALYFWGRITKTRAQSHPVASIGCTRVVGELIPACPCPDGSYWTEIAQKTYLPEYFETMRPKLRETYFRGISDEFLATPDGQSRMRWQLFERMLDTETYTMPWIEAGFPLSDATVLEIGCGSGNSTVPIARRARRVIAWDINSPALDVARARTNFFGLDNVDFPPVLPEDWIVSATKHLEGVNFDFVYLHAVLEHLTIGERITLLAALWEALPVGGAIGIYETPNRLNFFDWHSSFKPFMDWLPPELACLYLGKKTTSTFRPLCPSLWTTSPSTARKRRWRSTGGAGGQSGRKGSGLNQIPMDEPGIRSYPTAAKLLSRRTASGDACTYA
jgi:2-polyprenyl-3-methyl-5-hydroxy-6-metoxy-1,4-benzoquinol methylase